MNFIGIDLAWSENNLSGIAVITDTNELIVSLAKTNQEISDFISEFQIFCIGIDSPLTVKNLTGQRNCDTELNKVYRVYNAGVHPCNRNILTKYKGGPRGENLLKNLNIKEDIDFNPNTAIEIYPHPSMVNLFKLNKIIPYKARKNRPLDFRKTELKKYYELTYNFLKEEYNINMSNSLPILSESFSTSQLKQFEDQLDAVFCAIITKIAYTEPARREVFGDTENGAIVIIK